MRFASRKFLVRGRGEFPYDMLRYDRCFPASEVASSRMGYSPSTKAQITEVREVELICPEGRDPTPERWLSFGWRVVA